MWFHVGLLLTALVAVQAACTLKKIPAECECEDKNITCHKVWPSKVEIPQGVVSLTITGCNITTLDTSSNMFGSLSNLTFLNLTDNQIFNFKEASSFHHRQLPSLRELILDDNNLTMTHHQVFNGLDQLEVLSLRYAFDNSHKVIHDLTTTFFRSSFQSLRKLYLDNNDFGLLGVGMFQFDGGKPSSLELISLRNCSLDAILEKTFQYHPNPELKFLDLSANEIKSFDDAMKTLDDFNQFGGQLTINLTGNTFNCNCHLEEFRWWLNTTSVNVLQKDSLVCHTAFNNSLIGRSITSLVDGDLTCGNYPKSFNNDIMKTPYIILSIIFGIVGLLFLIILYMRRMEMQQWFIMTGTAIKDVFCSSRTGYSDIGRIQKQDEPLQPAPPAEV